MFRVKNLPSAFYHRSFSLSLLITTLLFCGIVIDAQKTAPNWRPESPSLLSPPQRYDFAMSTCQNGNVLIFGGATVESGFAYLNDTWVWDGSNWHDLSSQSNRPPVRGAATMAFDPVRNQVVMFGGQSYFPPYTLGDTWVFNGNFWIKMTPINSPAARFGASMAYDEKLQLVVLFGGQGGPNNTYLGETWGWNGSSWVNVVATHSSHSPLSVAGAMSYYPPGGFDVLFGGSGPDGYLTDTFYLGTFPILNIVLPDWINARALNFNLGSPPSRSDASMALYPVVSKIFLFGGNFFDLNTYSFNGVWNVEHPLSHPPGLTGARMAYHSNSGRVVLFGGLNSNNQDSNQTWTWGKQVACLPGDGSTVRVGSTVRCFFKEDPDVHFGYWTTDGLSPNSTTTLNKTFHTNGPGPASITATWFDSTGMHSETFNFTIDDPHH